MKSRGLALIVVVGILGVLAALAVAFVAMAELERRASEQRVNAARAYLLARSGIEDALARLALGQDPAYGGEDWNADAVLDGPEAGSEVFQRGRLNVEDCPARHAMRPSFFAADSLGKPRLAAVEGRDRGYSGALSGDYAPLGNAYALKVSSGQGFYINGGDPAAPSDTGYNRVLKRMLGILAEAVDRNLVSQDTLAPNDGQPVDQQDGWALIDARPSTGWKDWDQVRQSALGGSQEKLDALKPYLTLHAWVDRKVIAPNCHEDMIGKSYRSWGEMKLDHQETRAGSRAPDFEGIRGRTVGRAPVNLAWARKRWPALIALLAGLKGLTLDETTATPAGTGTGGASINGPSPDMVGTLEAAELQLDWTASMDDCRRIADQILASTDTFDTWAQWDAFCDGLALPDVDPNWRPNAPPSSHYNSPRPRWIGDLKQAKRDLLKANFNPNSLLNKFNPNLSMWHTVDKQDLLAYSTEFSLLPLAGPREVSSAGRVLGRDGRLLAGRTLGALVSGPEALRLTTQKEFVCEDLGRLNLAGDETGFRLPGRQPFISLGTGSSGTWGHALPGLEGRGLGLQTYPEPCVNDGSGLSIQPADYDGSIQLATLETRANAFYAIDAQQSPPPVLDMKMLARYTDDLDLDVADASPPAAAPLLDPRCNLPDVRQVTFTAPMAPPDLSELRFGLLHSSRPNTLYPDGCYAEKDRAPEYLDRGNADGFHGVFSFWVKSNHRQLSRWSEGRGHPLVKWTHFADLAPVFASTNQFFFLGDVHPSQTWFVPGLVCQFEIGHAAADSEMEHRFVAPRGLMPRRWHLVTCFWDFRSPTADNTGELIVDADAAGMHDVYSGYKSNNGALASDITLPDPFGPHRIGLGRGHPLHEGSTGFTGSGADATFDEFAIYDFGGAPPPTLPPGAPEEASSGTLGSPAALAAARYREGRYYRESDATWFSAPLRLGASRILGLAWTQVVPRELSQSTISFELVDVSGTGYLLDATGKTMDQRLTNAAFSPMNRAVRGAFRLHAVFQPNLADPINTPILDPLTLDDVTVLYEPLGGPQVLAWDSDED